MLQVLAERLKWACAAVAVATAGLLGTVPANAIVYQGAWDPAFGPAFPDLGWRGEANFFVPDACLNQSGWVLNTAPCSSGTMTILNAEVEFYKLSDPNNAAFHETLLFSMPSNAVDRMEFTDGELTGVFGTFTYSVPSTLPIAGAPFTVFRLFFEDDFARMDFVSITPDGERTGVSDPALVTFSRVVAEPGTLALMVAGLMLIAVAARRRTRSPRASLPALPI